jgi:hypothetical protein
MSFLAPFVNSWRQGSYRFDAKRSLASQVTRVTPPAADLQLVFVDVLMYVSRRGRVGHRAVSPTNAGAFHG